MMPIRITLLFAAAWFVTVLLRKQTAALRHVVWVAALAGSLLLPLLQWRMPERVIQASVPSIFATSPGIEVSAQAGTLLFGDAFLVLWSAGVCLLLAKIVWRRWRLGRLVGEARQFTRFGPIPVRITRKISGPGVHGLWRNTILVPEEASQWPAGTWRSVFTHEAAHIRRRDGITILVAEIARAIYWFHPFAWFAFSEMRKESERACDDAAIRLGLRPSSYAGHLLELARTFPLEPAIPMATTSHLEIRMKSILDPHVKRSAAAPRAWLVAAACTFAVLLPLSTITLRAQQTERPQSGAETAGQPTRIRVGGQVQAANLIEKVSPRYPEGAKSRGAQGSVSLDVLIGKDGVPYSIEPKPSEVDPDLVTAAIEAVRQWRYKPTLLNGVPVDVQTVVDVNFTLLP